MHVLTAKAVSVRVSLLPDAVRRESAGGSVTLPPALSTSVRPLGVRSCSSWRTRCWVRTACGEVAGGPHAAARAPTGTRKRCTAARATAGSTSIGCGRCRPGCRCRGATAGVGSWRSMCRRGSARTRHARRSACCAMSTGARRQPRSSFRAGPALLWLCWSRAPRPGPRSWTRSGSHRRTTQLRSPPPSRGVSSSGSPPLVTARPGTRIS